MGTPPRTGTPTRKALTSFVGRRHELGRLRTLLSASRLVTITGPGGAGKTRLAEEFVAGLARSISDGIAVAYLAAATGPIAVAEVTSAAVGLRNMGSRGVGAELVDYLRERRLVLVLDNCEHVGVAAAELTADLLRACPGIVIVATGRQPLHVPGEQIFPIGGLGQDLAVELFVDRARLSAPDFALDAPSSRLVAELCTRLDGMPLAIELAASQVGSLGLGELIRGLQGHVPELASRSAVGPERQRTLRQAIAWSHDLLSDAQRTLWRRLSVFSGGFTLDAAQQVAGVAPIGPSDVQGLVGDLVDQSMVVFEPAADRYRLLEVLREFARERLRDAGEEALAVERHRRWMIGLADDCDERWFGPEQAQLIERMHIEAGNLRAALEGCRETDPTGGLRLASDAFWYWLTRASLEEGLRWCQTFLGRSGDLALEAQASWHAGYLATMRREFDGARELVQQAFDAAAAADDALARAYARIVAGAIVSFERPREAEEARRLSAETLEDPVADTMARAWALIGVALAYYALGDWAACGKASLQGVELSREAGELWCRELSLRFVAYAEWNLGRPEAAEVALRECLGIDRRLDDVWHMASSMEALGWVVTDRGQHARGARLLGIASALWAVTGSGLAPYTAPRHVVAMDRLREHLGPRRLSAEIEAGRKLGRTDALAFALEEPAGVSGASVPSPEHNLQPLSARELEVAALVATGLSNRAIAEKLFLSSRTVDKHVEHVMDKLGIGSRAEIAAWHARRGATSIKAPDA